jgi:hypothetical protein
MVIMLKNHDLSCEPILGLRMTALLFYVVNEAQLNESGECRADARSELWIVDARDMKTVIGKANIAQRVQYSLHGNLFPEKQILHQRPVEMARHPPELVKSKTMDVGPRLWPLHPTLDGPAITHTGTQI